MKMNFFEKGMERLGGKLFHKLFVAFLITEVVIVIVLIGTLQYYTSQNFTNYVNQMELERQAVVITALQNHYTQYRSWDRLQGDFPAWRELLVSALAKLSPGTMPQGDNFQGPGWGRGQGRGMGMQGRGSGLGNMIGQRLTLFDQNHSPVVGSATSTKGYLLSKIEVNGTIQGWLGLQKAQQVSNPLDIDFLQQQSKIFYWLGLGIIVLAVLITWFVSHQISAPLQKITKGTQALAARQFETRIAVSTQDELGELANNFNTMAQTLENYEQLRQQWISDLSHELGTPLSILQGEVEAMQDGIRALDETSLDSLHFEITHLGQIIKDCKEISLAETRGMAIQKESIDLLDTINKTFLLFQTRLEEHQITVEMQLDLATSIYFQGDEKRLIQLFSNLLENTIRYVQSPGHLKIWKTEMPTSLAIHLEDSGPGVPEETLPYLFDRFYRVEPSRNRSQGGSGLGLAICKHIVEAHGGHIRANNSSGKGLHLEIQFPLS